MEEDGFPIIGPKLAEGSARAMAVIGRVTVCGLDLSATEAEGDAGDAFSFDNDALGGRGCQCWHSQRQAQ